MPSVLVVGPTSSSLVGHRISDGDLLCLYSLQRRFEHGPEAPTLPGFGTPPRALTASRVALLQAEAQTKGMERLRALRGFIQLLDTCGDWEGFET